MGTVFLGAVLLGAILFMARYLKRKFKGESCANCCTEAAKCKNELKGNR